VLVLCGAGRPQELGQLSYEWLFLRLADLDALPTLIDAKAGHFSSHSAANGHSDCNNFLRREGETVVLAEMKGPGCIYRWWSTGFGPKDRLRIYLDGSEKPSLEMTYLDFFTSPESFAAPAAGMSSGGYYCYAPIPYDKSCKIEIGNPSGLFFYNIDYLTFGSGNHVSTLTFPPPSDYRAALERCASVWKAAPGKRIRRLPGEMTTGGRNPVAPGETAALIELTGNGRIREFRLRLQTMDPEVGRKLILRMYWDGETQPSVEAPVQDFFGCGMWMVNYDSYPMGQGADDGYYCFLPMPFSTSARITIENQSDRAISVIPSAIWVPDAGTTDDTGRLHALWHRQYPTSKSDPWYTAVEIEGRGQLVGVTLAAQSFVNGWYFYEGDEAFDIDGAHEVIRGTGLEDYFNCGWYFNDGPVHRPFHGSTVDDDATHQASAYRWHIPDVVPFEKSLRLRFETWPDMEFDYSTVCYWYQIEPHKPFAPILAVEKRLHTPGILHLPGGGMNAEDLKVAKEPEKGKLVVSKWSEDGLWFDDGAKLEMRSYDVDDSIAFAFDAPSDDLYDIDLYMLAGPWWGRVSFAIDGTQYGDVYDGFLYGFAPRVLHTLNDVPLKAGEHVMTMTVIDRMRQAMGYFVGIDYLVLRPDQDKVIREWTVLGPIKYDGEHRHALMNEPVLPADEQAAKYDPSAQYDSGSGSRVGWRNAVMGPDSCRGSEGRWMLDFNVNLGPRSWSYGYAHTFVYSPDDREVELRLGSDDTVKVWLNGELVHTNAAERPVNFDDDRLSVHLREGWNELLFRVGQGEGGWGLAARFIDLNGDLKYAASPPD
jgi:hypothetical protein